MLVLLWILVALASIAVALIVVGLLLPEIYGSSGKIRLRQPPEAVWEAIADYERHPISGAMCKELEEIKEDADRPAWRENIKSTILTVRTIEATPPRRLARVFEDAVVPLKTRWDYEIRPENGGSLVAITEEGRIDRGTWHVPFFRIIVRLTKGSGVRSYLNGLASAFGEDAKAS